MLKQTEKYCELKKKKEKEKFIDMKCPSIYVIRASNESANEERVWVKWFRAQRNSSDDIALTLIDWLFDEMFNNAGHRAHWRNDFSPSISNFAKQQLLKMSNDICLLQGLQKKNLLRAFFMELTSIKQLEQFIAKINYGHNVVFILCQKICALISTHHSLTSYLSRWWKIFRHIIVSEPYHAAIWIWVQKKK